jgi:hypothetical protein
MESSYKKQTELLTKSIIFQDTHEISKLVKGHVEVYVDGYLERLLKAITVDYPLLKNYLKESEFNELALSFIDKNPPKYWDLNIYPTKFAKFIKKDKLAKDIAKLEGGILEVFWAAESEDFTFTHLANYSPEDLMEKAIFKPKPASKLISLNYQLNDYLINYRNGLTILNKPLKQKEYLHIVRTNNEVKRFVLEKPEFLILKSILQGNTMEKALEKLTKITQENLSAYIIKWIESGFFIAPLQTPLQP